MCNRESHKEQRNITNKEEIGMKPTRFWTSSGKGVANYSIIAYHKALYDTGVANQNLVPVSSVPPAYQIEPIKKQGLTWVPFTEDNAKIIKKGQYYEQSSIIRKPGFEFLQVPHSTILYVVQAKVELDKNEAGSAAIGLAWYWIDEEKDIKGVYAVEGMGKFSPEECLRRCNEKMDDILDGKNPIKNLEKQIIISSLQAPENQKGVVISLVVFDPFTIIYP